MLIFNPDTNMRIFTSPQTVSLTVVGGLDYISNINPSEIQVFVDFSKWVSEKQFYELDVKEAIDIVRWMYHSPKKVELIVTQKNN